jgi:putative spermidine/putrescine transport system ATP-binding protein
VARFLGASNILAARVEGVDGDEVRIELGDFGDLTVPRARAPQVAAGTPARLVVRAEKLHLRPPKASDPVTVAIPGQVETVDYQGQSVRYFVRAGGHLLQAINMIDERPFGVGEPVSVHLRGRDCAALPA